MIFSVCLTILLTLGVIRLKEVYKLFRTNHTYIKTEFNSKWAEINGGGMRTELLRKPYEIILNLK